MDYCIPVVLAALIVGALFPGITKLHLLYAIIASVIICTVFWRISMSIDVNALIANSTQLMQNSENSTVKIDDDQSSKSFVISVMMTFLINVFSVFIFGKLNKAAK